MDFGKKGDAKKAMKLMWKEGITLNRLGRKLSLVKNLNLPRERIAVSQEKACPETSKESYETTLERGYNSKQAWKKVQKKNKFGDAVCPEGYELNPNFTGAGASRTTPMS